MAINLTTQQQKQLEEELLRAFDADRLQRMLRLELGFRIEDEINTNRGRIPVVSDLVDRAIQENWADKLILAALAGNTSSIRLKEFAGSVGITILPKLQTENIEAGIAQKGSLEKTVRERAPLMVFADFSNRLADIGPRICRIEYPEADARGTGWLVGPDLLLTAYHVIENIHNQSAGLAPSDIICRFDYTNENAPAPGRTVTVSVDWLLDHSRYSHHDLEVSSKDPAADELDYALIRLKESVGNDQLPSGKQRGWIEVKENAGIMARNDFVVIPQHPDGRILELAFGEITEYNKSGNRIRYDTNTEGGSSGSACFTIGLMPFGLHHAAGPTNKLKYNQAVPLREIIRSMIKKGIPAFWNK